ncbi:DUF58 domain-containing protein [Nocardioides korecus]
MAITWRVPLLVLVGLLPVVLLPSGTTVLLWVLLVLVLVGLDVLLAPRRSTLDVVRRPVGRVRQGDPGSTVLEVGATRRVRGSLRDAWQPSAGATGERHRLHLDAGSRQELVTHLRPTRRGDLRTDRVTVLLLGPLGLAGRQGALRVPGTVRVLPAFPSVRHLPSRLARLRELDGRAAVRVRGQGTEFDSLREYVGGDDVRSVDWRASARSRSVVVRTWQPERDRRVVIVLDTGRTSAGRVDDVPRLDSAMDAALLLATLAARAGDRVSFVAGDLTVRTRLQGSHRRDVVGAVQEAMAGLQPVLAETSWRRLVGAVDSLGRQRALVVLLTALEPSAVQAGLLPLVPPLTSRHRVVLASVRDPEIDRLARSRDDARATYDAAAAEQAAGQRDATARLLGALGVGVLDADAEDLPVRLADHYLSLKARGLL